MSGTVKQTELRALVEQQSFKCALTGVELQPETAAADHIKPVSKGGENVISNIQILHHKVNTAKGTMTNEEFIQMCKDVVRWIASQATNRGPLDGQKVLS